MSIRSKIIEKLIEKPYFFLKRLQLQLQLLCLKNLRLQIRLQLQKGNRLHVFD
jgi:hypothetical protein